MRNCLLTVLVVLSAGCVVNPVTGERELGLVSSTQEIAIGREQYVPAQQMQGGAYRTDPGLGAYVNRVGRRLAAASGVDLPYEFVVLNNSTPNAWALPGGKIAINRGLLTSLRNEAELAAVLGHEIAHAALRHGAKRIEREYAAQAVMIGVAIGASGSEYAREALVGTQVLATLLNQRYSRDAEREADFYGTQFMAKAGYDAYAAVTLQETFMRLAAERRNDWLQGLFASHPPSVERVANNRQLLRQLRAEGFTSGELNEPAYAAALRRVHEAAPAYEAFDEANVLYQEDDYTSALTRLGRALAVVPGEAQFHGLRGAIRYQQERYTDAVTNFDRAIARDDGYFFYYLNRGLARRALGQSGMARPDLTASLRLLPTSVAYQNLGELAEADGNMELARTYYEQAAQGQGASSVAARASLVRMELPDNPGKYLPVRLAADAQKRVAVQVHNRSAVALADVVIRVELQLPGGVRSRTVNVARLGAGKATQIILNVNAEQLSASRGYAVSASLAN